MLPGSFQIPIGTSGWKKKCTQTHTQASKLKKKKKKVMCPGPETVTFTILCKCCASHVVGGKAAQNKRDNALSHFWQEFLTTQKFNKVLSDVLYVLSLFYANHMFHASWFSSLASMCAVNSSIFTLSVQSVCSQS